MGAGCLLVLGLMITVGAIAGIARAGGLISPIGSLFMTVIGLGLVGAGIFSIRYVKAFERRGRHLFEEKAVLAVAARHGGVVTLPQITLDSALSVAEAEEVLRRLCREGIARMELDVEDGSIRYHFHGLGGKGTLPALE